MFTVRVNNFQSIESGEIEVSGLTVITGQNNTGKTALLRAVFGVFTNPRGYKYVRDGTPHCSVTLDFNDGKKVTWEKGDGVNRYIFNGGKPLENVGAGAPEEISDFGVQPMTVGDTNIWPQFAHQFTGQVFLLDRSGSVLAEAIADMDRVGVLNEALRLTQSDQRAATTEKKIRQTDVDRLEVEEKVFDGFESVEAKLVVLDLMDKDLQLAQARLNGVTTLRDRLRVVETTLNELSPIRDVSLPSDPGRLVKIDGALQWALSFRDRLETVNQSCDLAQKAKTQVQNVKVPQTPDFGTKLSDLAQLKSVVDTLVSLESAVSKLKDAQRVLEIEKVSADKEVTDLKALLKECPTCGAITVCESGCSK